MSSYESERRNNGKDAAYKHTVDADHGIRTPDFLFRSRISNLFTAVPLVVKYEKFLDPVEVDGHTDSLVNSFRLSLNSFELFDNIDKIIPICCDHDEKSARSHTF